MMGSNNSNTLPFLRRRCIGVAARPIPYTADIDIGMRKTSKTKGREDGGAWGKYGSMEEEREHERNYLRV